MKFLVWISASIILGNPLLAAIIVVALYWTLDRYTLGLLPDPLRLFSRWRRLSGCNRRLRVNSHDRKARLDKAEVLLELGWPKASLETVRYNIDAGDRDAYTLFIAGQAAFGSGDAVIGERLLELVRKDNPTFAQNRVDLELGRGQLNSKNFLAAQTALERFVSARSSAIEGNLLLSRAYAGLGKKPAASAARTAAWAAYQEAPGFLKRRERLWAWRANPIRPILYLSAALCLGSVISFFLFI